MEIENFRNAAVLEMTHFLLIVPPKVQQIFCTHFFRWDSRISYVLQQLHPPTITLWLLFQQDKTILTWMWIELHWKPLTFKIMIIQIWGWQGWTSKLNGDSNYEMKAKLQMLNRIQNSELRYSLYWNL